MKQHSLPLHRMLLLPLLLLMGISCGTHTIRKTPPTLQDMAGEWRLNPRETMRDAYTARGYDFDELTREEQRQVLESFALQFRIRFQSDGHWSGDLQEGTQKTHGEGVFEVLKRENDSITIRTMEQKKDSAGAGFARTLTLEFLSPRRIRIRFQNGEESSSLIIDRV